MNDDQLLLANAYLDGELDDADRARAEADAEVMGEVARLTDLRAVVRDVGEPTPGRREQAVAAALAAFATARATDARTTAPVPLASRSQRRWWGPVAAAAALVVVVAGGVALLGDGSGGDDDSAATEDVTLEAADGESAAATAPAAPAPAAPAPAGGDSRQDAATADTLPASSAASEDVATAEATTAPVPAAAAELGAVLTTPEELAAYAGRAGEVSAADAPPPTCSQPGTYRGPAVYGGVPVEVFLEGEVVVAVDVTSCQVVERVRP